MPLWLAALLTVVGVPLGLLLVAICLRRIETPDLGGSADAMGVAHGDVVQVPK